jgi:hypothetical protein
MNAIPSAAAVPDNRPVGIAQNGPIFLDFNSADPGKRRAVLRSLRNRRLQTAAGIAAPPRGSPAQLDRGTKPGDGGIVIDIRVTARPGRLAFQAAPAVDTQTWNL